MPTWLMTILLALLRTLYVTAAEVLLTWAIIEGLCLSPSEVAYGELFLLLSGFNLVRSYFKILRLIN